MQQVRGGEEETSPPLGQGSAIQRLRNQMRWVTRIATALSSTQNVEDIYNIILAGLLAPTGLGWSRAMLFEVDDAAGQLNGTFALGHESLESSASLQAELDEEDKFIEAHRIEIENSLAEEGASAEGEFYALESGSQWVTLVQRLTPDNAHTRRIEKLSFSLAPRPGDPPSVFDQASSWRRPRAFSRRELGPALPTTLGSLLPEYFAAVPVVTRSRLRALIIVDRHLYGELPVGDLDISELDWFSRQASLAIENAELIADVNNAYQELKQFDQLKSNFLSIISHELRTPLTSVGGFLSLILGESAGELNPNQRALLERASRNTAHLARLVNDLIELAELEVDGSVEVSLHAVDPLQVYTSTLPRLEQTRRRQSVDIVPVIDGDVPPILCEERALGRVLFHLLDNAMKFSHEGGRIEVRFQRTDGHLRISVSDHGVGIPREKLQRIFDHFYQVDGTLTRSHEGLGLGLAVTRMLVQATRGEVQVESQIGRGSTFSVIYPVAE